MFELIGGIQSVQLDDARRPQQLRAEERERETQGSHRTWYVRRRTRAHCRKLQRIFFRTQSETDLHLWDCL